MGSVFGGSCGQPAAETTDETFTVPSQEISWETCSFPTLFADTQALFYVIGAKSTWDENEACNDNDVRDVYENSAVLSQTICTESAILEAAALVSNTWFGTLVSAVRSCYGTS